MQVAMSIHSCWPPISTASLARGLFLVLADERATTLCCHCPDAADVPQPLLSFFAIVCAQPLLVRSWGGGARGGAARSQLGGPAGSPILKSDA